MEFGLIYICELHLKSQLLESIVSSILFINAGMQHMVRIMFTLRLVALHKWRHYSLSLSFFCSKKVQVQFCLDSVRLNFDAYCNFIR